MDDLINETGKLAKITLFLTKKSQKSTNESEPPIFDDYAKDALEKLRLANLQALDNLPINYFTNDNTITKVPNIGPQYRKK